MVFMTPIAPACPVVDPELAEGSERSESKGARRKVAVRLFHFRFYAVPRLISGDTMLNYCIIGT